jgi:ubiquinol-cytochrome c reductase cytochrome b subunit
VPNPFWGEALFPLVVRMVLGLWAWAERRITGDHRVHNLLTGHATRPGTAAGLAFMTWVFLVFVSGSADRAYVFLDASYATQIHIYRIAIWVVPAVVFVVARRWCLDLQRAERVEEERERAEHEARLAASAAHGPAAGERSA